MKKLRFHHLKPTPGSTKQKLRKGRGEAGKRGKTAGRGTKGTGARKTVPAYFEGGQIPLYRRIPKLRAFFGWYMSLKLFSNDPSAGWIIERPEVINDVWKN